MGALPSPPCFTLLRVEVVKDELVFAERDHSRGVPLTLVAVWD